jgi:hypothetical protein
MKIVNEIVNESCSITKNIDLIYLKLILSLKYLKIKLKMKKNLDWNY